MKIVFATNNAHKLSEVKAVLGEGFEFVQMARALVHDTDFVNKLQKGELTRSSCKHSNYCIGRMYSEDMRCHHCVEEMPERLKKEIEKLENQ